MSQCTECEKLFSRKDSMLRHVKTHHAIHRDQNNMQLQIVQTRSYNEDAMAGVDPSSNQQAGFYFKHPFTSIVSGPTSCGKTTFIKNLLQKNSEFIQSRIQRIIWLYRRWQPLYDDIARTVYPRVEFVQGLPDDIESNDFIQPNVRNLVVIDDLATACSKDNRVSDLFTEGSHHRNLSVIVLNQNLYHSKNPTERRNCQYLVLFKNPMDKQAVMTLARQMYPGKTGYFLKKFEDATTEPYTYLLIDLKADTKKKERFQTDILAIKENDEASSLHSIPDAQRVNIYKDDNKIDTMEGNKSTFIPIEKDTFSPCDDCGLVFDNVHDLQRHVRKWCQESHVAGPPIKRIKLDDETSVMQDISIPDAEMPVYTNIMDKAKEENETLWQKRVTKYMHDGLSEDEAVEKVNKKMEGSDMTLFMKKYSNMLLDIMQLNKGSLHQKIWTTIQDNIQKKYNETKAVKLALKQVHDEIHDMLQDEESDSESDNEDYASDDN